jgi:hypothetical protein
MPSRIMNENQKKHQFKPGVSGNPAGKPKGTIHFKTLLLDLLNHQVKNPAQKMFFVKDKKISAAQMIVISLFKRAISGDVSAIREIMDRADEVLPQITEVRHLCEEDEKILADLLDRDKRYAQYAKQPSGE